MIRVSDTWWSLDMYDKGTFVVQVREAGEWHTIEASYDILVAVGLFMQLEQVYPSTDCRVLRAHDQV